MSAPPFVTTFALKTLALEAPVSVTLSPLVASVKVPFTEIVPEVCNWTASLKVTALVVIAPCCEAPPTVTTLKALLPKAATSVVVTCKVPVAPAIPIEPVLLKGCSVKEPVSLPVTEFAPPSRVNAFVVRSRLFAPSLTVAAVMLAAVKVLEVSMSVVPL